MVTGAIIFYINAGWSAIEEKLFLNVSERFGRSPRRVIFLKTRSSGRAELWATRQGVFF